MSHKKDGGGISHPVLPSAVPAVLSAGEYVTTLRVKVVQASQGLVTVRNDSNG